MLTHFCPFSFTHSYDVWLGNARGNKYSLKHMFLKPHEKKFWEFSMDELALFDMPDTVDVRCPLLMSDVYDCSREGSLWLSTPNDFGLSTCVRH